MEGDELFDANLLEQTVNSLIEEGKRNFAIDLTKIDYLYSDSINKFINLNRKVLNVYGRLALLSPSKQVSQILKRAGIENFLKIYPSSKELEKASSEIIRQTTSFSVKDIEGYKDKEKKPVSEYKDFRSEIGKALEASPLEQSVSMDSLTKPDTTFTPPTKPQTKPFESHVEEIQKPDFITPKPPSAPQPQKAASLFDESLFDANFSPAPSQFQDFTQEAKKPPTPPPKSDQSEVPTIPTFEATPPVKPKFAPSQPPLDFDQPPVAPPMPEAAPPPTPKSPQKEAVALKPRIPEREEFLERYEFLEEKEKKFPIPLIIIPIIAVLIIAVGYFVLFNPFKEDTAQTTAKIEKKVTQEIPQIAVTKEVKTTPEEIEVPETPVEPEKIIKKEAPSKREKISTPTKQVKKPVVSNRIIITSYPSNAKIFADGKLLGRTPYTWKNPSVYGMVSISVDKKGYKVKKKNVEFTGGTAKKHFALVKKPVAPRPKPVTARPKPKPITRKPVVTTKPATTTPVTRPETKPIGGTGTIFISSLPPMADVYMDGRKIGKTNIDKLKVSAGTHTMRFVKGGKEVTKTMTFIAGENPSQLIRIK